MNPEVAVDFSGGGFSNYFERPHYQEAAVSAYLSKIGNANAGLYKCVSWNDIGGLTELTDA